MLYKPLPIDVAAEIVIPLGGLTEVMFAKSIGLRLSSWNNSCIVKLSFTATVALDGMEVRIVGITTPVRVNVTY
jgi:hypothetical protein